MLHFNLVIIDIVLTYSRNLLFRKNNLPKCEFLSTLTVQSMRSYTFSIPELLPLIKVDVPENQTDCDENRVFTRRSG
jgi:hypothetical protein